MIMCAVTFALMTRIVGPLVLVPTLTISATMIFAMYPFAHVQRVATVIMFFATLGPMFLEWLGVLPSSYIFQNDQLCVVPQIAHLPATATLAVLAITPNVLLVMASIGIRRIRKSLSDAEQRLALQAWQFRQLVPERARHRV
jgi:serine/threonine-protein kinase